MEYPEHESRYTARGCLLVLVMIIISISACGGVFYVAVDASCVSDAELWLADYPYSVVQQETFTFFRPFGIGQTTRLLYSPDPINAVRAWYMARDTRLIGEGNIKNRGYARVTYLLRESSVGSGTDIILRSSCAQGLSVGMEESRTTAP